MASHISDEQAQLFLQAALECSVYLAPTEPGLTYEEIYRAGAWVGLHLGEIGHALPGATNQPVRNQRLMPHSNAAKAWSLYHLHEKPDYRNFEAIDLVISELRARVAHETDSNAAAKRSVLVELALVRQISEIDIEAAITILIMSGQIIENGNSLHLVPGAENRPLPGETHARAVLANQAQPKHNEMRMLAYPIVKQVLRERASRAAAADPLDAFTDEITKLGFGPLRMWWKQAVAELRHCDAQLSPVAAAVLAAALVEGALIICVRHARALKLGTMAALPAESELSRWSIGDLVAGAATGNEAAILDSALRYSVETLMMSRQRIHPGWILSEFPDNLPHKFATDRADPKAIAGLVVARVIAWLQEYPPEPPALREWSDDAGADGDFAVTPNWQAGPLLAHSKQRN